MTHQTFNDGEWFKAHPERVRESSQNYTQFRNDGYSVDESLAAARAIEVELWLEEGTIPKI